MPDFAATLDAYLSTLAEHGSLVQRALRPIDDASRLDALDRLDQVRTPAALRSYFQRVDGVDDQACRELDLFEPQLAWGMFPLSLQACLQHHDGCTDSSDDEDYWPIGFLPILADGTGSYVVVNARRDSPTWGAVYDMSEGVGCNRIAHSLEAFFAACAREAALGLRRYARDVSELGVEPREWLVQAAGLFGPSPFFARPGRMGDQIVDWK